MLAGITPTNNARTFNPAFFAGNDPYCASYINCECPSVGYIGSAIYLKEAGFGASRNRLINGGWQIRAGAPFNDMSVNTKIGPYVFFNGSASLVAVPTGPELLPTGDFTIDGWVFPVAATGGIYGAVRDDTLIGPYLLTIDNTLGHFRWYSSANGTAWDVSGAIGGAYTLNTWHHVAFVRKGGSYTTYLNGNAVASGPCPGPRYQGLDAKLTIGAQGLVSFFTGAIDNFRLSNGIARWTTNFGPPNQPYYAAANWQTWAPNDGNDEATTSLWHFDNSLFDSAAGAITLNNLSIGGAAQFAGAAGNPLIGANVGFITNDGDYFFAQPGWMFDFMAANFTIEFWYYRNAPVGSNTQIIGKRHNDAEFAPWLIVDDANTFRFYASADGANWNYNISFGAVALQTWTHIAVTRYDDGWIRVFNNGANPSAQFAGNQPLMYNPSKGVTIGGNLSRSGRCYIDELRISKVCRWINAFTPRAAGTKPYS